MKKILFSILSTTLLLGIYLVNATEYSSGMQEAYEWAYENGIISDSSIDDANLYKPVTKREFLDIMNKFNENVLNHERDLDKYPNTGNTKEDEILITSYELGLSTLLVRTANIAEEGNINRAIFGEALSISLRGNKYSGGDPYYKKHLEALKSAGIINQIDNPENRTEIKGYVLSMLMKAAEDYNEIDCNDPDIILVCPDSKSNTYNECPDICRPNGILTNNLTKTIEFKANEDNTKIVFDGTYKALKDGIIKGFSLEHNNIDQENCKKDISYNDITYKLYMNGELVGSNLNPNSNALILNTCQFFGSLNLNKAVSIKEGESVQIKIEGKSSSAEFGDSDKAHNFAIKLSLYDKDGDKEDAIASENLAPIRIVETNTNCKGMDKANVNHSVKSGTVNLRRDTVDGDYVKIFVFNPFDEEYQSLGTAKMSDKKFSYKVPWAGEHELLLTNGCKEVIYKIEADTVKCEGMDSAKVSHTVDNDTITLKWNTIEGDNVEISIFDPDSESYKNLGTVKMNNKKFTYKIKWEGEQNFLLSNGCNNYNYKVNITKAKKEEITSKYGTISIANPDNKNEGITIMDKNLGATSNDISSSNSYGYYYQWGNNYGFNRKNKISTSSDKATRNSKYDNHGFYDNFFRITSRDYWTDGSHNGLRGGEYDSYDNDWGANEKNPHNRQGPCPDGYHVPSAGEWGLLIKYRKNTYDKNVEIKGGQGQFSFADKTATENFSKFFKLPLAGNLNSYDGSTERQGENGVYWSSSTNIENEGYAEHLYIQYNSSVRDASIGKESTLSQVYATAASPRSEGMPIRCFKNTYDPVSQEVIYEENLEEVIEQLIEKEEDIAIQGKDAQKIEKSNLNPSDILENGYTREMNDAYEFAHEKGITTTNSIEKAKMDGTLTRIAMAKMLSQFAMNVLGKDPDLSKGTVKFNDVTEKQNLDYNNAVTLAYQLGIMGQNMKSNNFRPNDEVTRAEFTTALSRMLYSTPDGDPYYTTHLKKLKEEGIIKNDNPKLKEKRGYVMLMLMRSIE